MKRQEFFDKIDNIRNVLNDIGRNDLDEIHKAIGLLEELRADAELMLDDEHGTEDTSARAYGHGC